MSLAQSDGLDSSLLMGCGPSGVDFGTAERVPATTLYRMWERVIAHTGDESIPVRLARAVSIDELGLLGYTALTAPTMEASFAAAVRFYPLITNDGAWTMRMTATEIVFQWSRSRPNALGVCSSNESVVAHFIECSRQIYGQHLLLKQVQFTHREPDNSQPMRSFCECKVVYSADVNSITIGRENTVRNPRLAQEKMHTFLCSLASDAVGCLGSPLTRSEVNRVQEEIRRLLSTGDATANNVAAGLGITRRTMHRRLALEGTSYQSEIDEIRRTQAAHLVSNTAQSLTAIALDLGFAEQSSLSRAFRQWFGESPSALRRRIEQKGPRAY